MLLQLHWTVFLSSIPVGEWPLIWLWRLLSLGIAPLQNEPHYTVAQTHNRNTILLSSYLKSSNIATDIEAHCEGPEALRPSG